MPAAFRITLLIILQSVSLQVAAEKLRVAVAANFKPALEQLAKAYERSHPVQITISAGATGALYAQLLNGAPFDVFFAADSRRPERLEAEGLTRLRKTYAIGELVFWYPKGTPTLAALSARGDTLAIANPRHAPYGAAAAQVLANLKASGNPRLVYGNSVAQAFTFIATGNAGAGLIAMSQIVTAEIPAEQYLPIPETLHNPIEQQLVVLRSAVTEADDFVSWLNTANAQTLIKTSGYRVPYDD